MNFRETILDLIEKRQQARLNKDWALSDSLRIEIAKLGVDLRDTPNGQEYDEWRLPINPLLGEPFKVGDAVFVYHTDMVKLFSPVPKYWYLGETVILEVNKKEIAIDGLRSYLHSREKVSYDLNGVYRIRPHFYPFTDLMKTMTPEALAKKNEEDAREEAKSGSYFFLSLIKEIPKWQQERIDNNKRS